MENRKKIKVCCLYFIHSLLFFKLLNALTAEDPEKLKIVPRKLHMPSLDELKTVLHEALSKNFAEVNVEIVTSPDLTLPPFVLAAEGLGGKPTILDVGGMSFYSPEFEKNKLYDIKTLVNHLGYNGTRFVIGAAHGPWTYLNKDCDVRVNVILDNRRPIARSYINTLNKILGTIEFHSLYLQETRFSVQGNLFLSEGKPGKVLKVNAKKRIGEDNFITSMRKGIEKRYRDKELVAIGGTFVVQAGMITHHFRNFLEEPAPEGSKLRRIKNFYLYDFQAPENAVGTFISARTERDLYLEHFHMFSHLKKANKGGHYVQDTTPEIVEYEGYFAPAEMIYKIDQAPPFCEI